MTRPFLPILLCMMCAGGCAGAGGQKPLDKGLQQAEPAGPKVRVMVADFEVKAAKATQETGAGLRDMLISALITDGRYTIVERPAQTGQKGAPPGSVVISAAITAFEPLASGGSAGIGGGGGSGSGIMGGLLGRALDKAHIALDLRVIDSGTSQILAASKVQGQASDIAGGLMAAGEGNISLPEAVSAYANTPMEKAIRICVMEAVRYISQSIPESYYN